MAALRSLEAAHVAHLGVKPLSGREGRLALPEPQDPLVSRVVCLMGRPQLELDDA